MNEIVSLREKFYGCIVGVHVGSALAAPVETWEWQKIEETYGTLNTLLPYHHYKAHNNWIRQPGTTEDGVERQKLIITAIIEKQDRVNCEDIRKIWLRDIKPEACGTIAEPFEGALLAAAGSNIPARDIGRYNDYSALGCIARSGHPIGLINAGDLRGAMEDIYEVGQLYNAPNARSIQWGTVTAVAVAAAVKRGATVDSVIGAIYDHCDAFDNRYTKFISVIDRIDRVLKATLHCQDFRELRIEFSKMFNGGDSVPCGKSHPDEVVSKGIAIFRMVKGNTWEAIVAGANSGRDTDCLTAVAAGISGALTGAGTVPEEIILKVDEATKNNPYTNNYRTMRESADGLYDAYIARMKSLKALHDEMLNIE